MPRPLFSSGTARGGTNLQTLMLSVHPGVSMAQDPFLPLFRSFRNAAVRAADFPTPPGFDPKGPLDEYYYMQDRLSVMRRVQAADLDLRFDPSERAGLLEALEDRTILSSPLLVPHLDRLGGDTYRDLFASALNVVALGRNTPDAPWLGFNDNWAVEFFAPLARAFPEARFIIVVRDVRSSLASEAREKPPQIALTLSFVRCWRKQVAFAAHNQQQSLFEDRLLVTSYESIVQDPERAARTYCEFLELEYTPDMIDSTKFVSPEGGAWTPNTNFEDSPQHGIYATSIDRWKTQLDDGARALAELVAGPDLEAAGYAVLDESDMTESLDQIYAWHVESDLRCQGWRTDNGDAAVDLGFELLRRGCLKGGSIDPDLVERCFLFPEAHEWLVGKQELLHPSSAPAIASTG